MGNKTWKFVIKGWKDSVVTSEDGTFSLKPEADRTGVEYEEALGNSKVLNFIFNNVDKNMFRFINTCLEVKEAKKILKTTHECTSKVRMSRL